MGPLVQHLFELIAVVTFSLIIFELTAIVISPLIIGDDTWDKNVIFPKRIITGQQEKSILEAVVIQENGHLGIGQGSSWDFFEQELSLFLVSRNAVILFIHIPRTLCQRQPITHPPNYCKLQRHFYFKYREWKNNSESHSSLPYPTTLSRSTCAFSAQLILEHENGFSCLYFLVKRVNFCRC